jgi:hypothetical protein
MPVPIESRTVTERVESIVRSLRSGLGEGLDAAVIRAEVEAELAACSGARVQQFLPIIVERRVWARLCQERSSERGEPDRTGGRGRPG